MRKLFWMMMTSLDGFMAGPDGELDWHVTHGEFARYVGEMLRSIDAILLGRTTYELFASYWPTSTQPEARALNELPKVVFSRTLSKVEWSNSRLVKDDAEGEVARLKREAGKDLVLLGSAALASVLVRAGLVDEYRVLVNPVLLGAGVLTFKNVGGRTPLRLRRARALDSGVVVLDYLPA